MVVPRLGDIRPTKTSFVAGERVIARVNQILTADQKKKILQGINKYAGVELNSLIVDCTRVNLVRIRKEESISVAGPSHMSSKAGPVLHFGCSKVCFEEGDSFLLSISYQDPRLRNLIIDEVKRWIGDHEVSIIPWKIS